MPDAPQPTMDAARRWRDEKLVEQSELALRRAADPECPRCEGTGRVLWFGHRGQGGVDGPCIRCHPLAAAQFAENHNPFNLRRQNDGIR